MCTSGLGYPVGGMLHTQPSTVHFQEVAGVVFLPGAYCKDGKFESGTTVHNSGCDPLATTAIKYVLNMYKHMKMICKDHTVTVSYPLIVVYALTSRLPPINYPAGWHYQQTLWLLTGHLVL